MGSGPMRFRSRWHAAPVINGQKGMEKAPLSARVGCLCRCHTSGCKRSSTACQPSSQTAWALQPTVVQASRDTWRQSMRCDAPPLRSIRLEQNLLHVQELQQLVFLQASTAEHLLPARFG